MMIMEKLTGDETVERNRQAYDIIARPYGQAIDNLVDGWIAEYTKKLLDSFLCQASYSSGKAKILEIGPGNGSAAKYLSEKGARVTGIDISVKMMEQAMARAPKASFFQMDMRKIVFPSRTFDGVWADGCVYHVTKDDVVKVFRGVRRVMKTGGILFFNFKVGTGEVLDANPKSFGGASRFYAYYSRREMTEIVEGAGFALLSIAGYPEKVLGEEIVYIMAQKV